MSNQPKRRIHKCYLCENVIRKVKTHLMYYTGPDLDMKSEIAMPVQVEEKKVRICGHCYVLAGYVLKELSLEQIEKAEEDAYVEDWKKKQMPLPGVEDGSTGGLPPGQVIYPPETTDGQEASDDAR